MLCLRGDAALLPVRAGQHTQAPLLLPQPGGSHADIISRLLQNSSQVWAEPGHATEWGREPAGTSHRCVPAPPQRSGSICLPGIRFPDLLVPPGRGCYKAQANTAPCRHLPGLTYRWPGTSPGSPQILFILCPRCSRSAL